MSPLLSAFPSRPLRLRQSKGPSGTWLAGLAVGGVLLLITLIGGFLLLRQYQIRSHLLENGVEVAATYPSHHCARHYKSRNVTCTAQARYRLAPEQGSEARESRVVFDGYQDFAGNPPPIVYDPAKPERLLPRPQLTLPPGDIYFLAAFFPAGLEVILAIALVASAFGRRRRQRAVGHPVLLQVLDMTRSAQGVVTVVYKDPRSGKPAGAAFPPGTQPFLAPSEAAGAERGASCLVALQAQKGWLYPLDESLSRLDLTDVERRAIIERAFSLRRTQEDRAARSAKAGAASGGILDAFPPGPLRLSERAMPPRPGVSVIIAIVGLGLAAYPLWAIVTDLAGNGLTLPSRLDSQIDDTPWLAYALLAAFPLLFAFLGTRGAILLGRSRRRMRQVEGEPIFVPILDMSRNDARYMTMHFHNAITGAPDRVVFDGRNGNDPFLVGRPSARGPGSSYFGALMTADGTLYPFDAKLTYLEMTDEERRSVRRRAGFE